MERHIIFAPHLDDEILGCYSILSQIDLIVYFTRDYREELIKTNDKYIYHEDFNPNSIIPSDTIYLPSKFDYHPMHTMVRKFGHTLVCNKMYYSIEMNVPWLEEELDPKGKQQAFNTLYPNEDMHNDKYFLFKSIKPYDDIVFAVIRTQFEQYHCWPTAPDVVDFLRNLHRHIFHVEVKIQQFHDDRDIEFILFNKEVQNLIKIYDWKPYTSCEMMGNFIKLKLELKYPNRLIEVGIYEDNENGVLIK